MLKTNEKVLQPIRRTVSSSSSVSSSRKIENYYFSDYLTTQQIHEETMQAQQQQRTEFFSIKNKTANVKELKEALEDRFGAESMQFTFEIHDRPDLCTFIVKANANLIIRICEFLGDRQGLINNLHFRAITL